MSEIHPYAQELAQKIGANSRRQIYLKLRTLLNGFGFYRRTEAIVQTVNDQLKACGLAANLTLNQPQDLDDRVTVRKMGETSAPLTELMQAQVRPAHLTQEESVTHAVNATVEMLTDTGSGSGFIVHPDGLVVTARHVVDEDGLSRRKVQVRLFPDQKDEKTLEATVFRSHRQLDFALLWLEGAGPYSVLPVGNAGQARHTQTVYAIGAPAGMPNTVSRGIISNPNGRLNGIEVLQTDAAVDRGNSGGPLVTQKGEVIGINLWGIGNFDAAKFAVPMDYLTTELKRAIEAGREKCLAATYCPVCGFSDFGEQTWFCRNCGAQWANLYRDPRSEAARALVAEVVKDNGLQDKESSSFWWKEVGFEEIPGVIAVLVLEGEPYQVINAPLLVAPEGKEFNRAPLQNLILSVGVVPGMRYALKGNAVYLEQCLKQENLAAEKVPEAITGAEQLLAEERQKLAAAAEELLSHPPVK